MSLVTDFSEYLRQQHRTQLTTNPASVKGLMLPTIVRNPVSLSPDQETQLFESTKSEDPFLAHRDRILAKLCRSGLSLQNILDLDVEQVDNLLASLAKIQTNGLDVDLSNYVAARKEKWPKSIEKKLFLNCNGQPLSSRSVRRKINFYGKRIGMSNVNPRTLKNTYLQSRKRKDCYSC